MNENTKVHDLIIDINANEREKAVNSRTQFFTMDAETGKMSIQFMRRGLQFDLTGATVLIGFHFVDKWASKVIDSEDGSVEIVDAVGGKCNIDIPSHVYGYEGDVMVHVYLKFESGQSLDCGVIATRFERSWLDQETPEMEKVYVQRFENLAREIRERAEELNRLLDGVDGAIVSQEDFDNHVNDMNNPHRVTVGQITGLQSTLENMTLQLKELENITQSFSSSGEWTPQMTIGNRVINGTYGAETAGSWTKVGNIVHISGRIDLTYTAAQLNAALNNNSESNNNFRITGLPFLSNVGNAVHSNLFQFLTQTTRFGGGGTSNFVAVAGTTLNGTNMLNLWSQHVRTNQLVSSVGEGILNNVLTISTAERHVNERIRLRFSGTYQIAEGGQG